MAKGVKIGTWVAQFSYLYDAGNGLVGWDPRKGTPSLYIDIYAYPKYRKGAEIFLDIVDKGLKDGDRNFDICEVQERNDWLFHVSLIPPPRYEIDWREKYKKTGSPYGTFDKLYSRKRWSGNPDNWHNFDEQTWENIETGLHVGDNDYIYENKIGLFFEWESGTRTGGEGYWGIGGYDVLSGSDKVNLPSIALSPEDMNQVPTAVLTVPSLSAGRTAEISWEYTDADGDEVKTLSLYRYLKKAGASSFASVKLGVSTSSKAFGDSIPADAGGATIYYRLGFTDGYAEDQFVESSQTVVVENSPPSVPSPLTVTNGLDDATIDGKLPCILTWVPSTDPDGDAVSYRLEREVDGGGFREIYSGDATTYTDEDDKTAWKTVSYRVRAVDPFSAFSDYAATVAYTVGHNTLPTAALTVPALKEGQTARISWRYTDEDGDTVKTVSLTRYIKLLGEGEFTSVSLIADNASPDAMYYDDTIPSNAAEAEIYYRLGFTDGNSPVQYVNSRQASAAQNEPPTVPAFLTVAGAALETGVSGLSAAVLSWGESTDPDGNLAGYLLERSVNGAGFTQIYKGPLLTYSDGDEKEKWETVSYRVSAYDALDAFSGCCTTAVFPVTLNHAPVITPLTVVDGGNFGRLTSMDPPEYRYKVSDPDGDTVTVEEYIDGTLWYKREIAKDAYEAENTFLFAGREGYLSVLNGEHTLKVQAVDGKGGASEVSVPFTKEVEPVEIELSDVTPSADRPQSIRVAVEGIMPAGSALSVRVTNNAMDEEPVWEDYPADALESGASFEFTNQVLTGDAWAVSVRVKLERGSAQEICAISKVSGTWRGRGTGGLSGGGVSYGPATADTLGLVKIGANLAVTKAGLLSADVGTEDLAAKTEEAVLSPELWREDETWGHVATVSVAGVSADEKTQRISWAPAAQSRKAALEAGIFAVAEGEGTVTFACETVPEAAVTLYITAEPLKEGEE